MNPDFSIADRPDYRAILELVEPGRRVLDLGCGGGELLGLLAREKSVIGQGVELGPENVSRCVSRGVSVIHADVDEGLADYPDGSFDYVILNQTLQVVKAPDRVLREMARVGKTGIVGFPNFGYYRIRLNFLWQGRMPTTPELPHPWYSTPNIHLCTLRDFEDFLAAEGLEVIRRVLLGRRRALAVAWRANWRAVQAIYLIRRAPAGFREGGRS